MKFRIILTVLLLMLSQLSLSFSTYAQDDDECRHAFNLIWSPDGRWIGVGSMEGVWVYDADDLEAEPLHFMPENLVTTIAFDATGTYIAIPDNINDTVQVIEISTGDVYRTFDTPQSGPDDSSIFYDMRFSANNKHLIIGNQSLLYIFDVEADEAFGSYNFADYYVEQRISYIASVSDTANPNIFLATTRGSNLNAFDVTEGMISQYNFQDMLLTGVTALDESTYLIFSSGSGMYRFDVETETATLIEQPIERITGFAVSADRRFMATGGIAQWVLYDLQEDTVLLDVQDIEIDDERYPNIWYLAFNADATQLATLHIDGVIAIWDTLTGELLTTINDFCVASIYGMG